MRTPNQVFIFISTVVAVLVGHQAMAVQSQCNASNYEQVAACLNLPEATNGTGVQIVIHSDIVLDLNQTIRVDGRKRITIEGDSTRPAPVISDTVARAKSTGPLKQNGNNASLIEITSDSSDILLRHFAIRDFGQRPNELKARCRIGGDAKNPDHWDKDLCYSPLFVGSARVRSSAEFPQRVSFSDLSVDSDKSILVEIGQVADLIIENSRFSHGTVFGVHFQQKFSHTNIKLQNNDFVGSGTNAILLSNVNDVLVQGNRLTDNHIDPQFMVCRTESSPVKSGACPGGQILLADNPNAPVRNVKIIGNTITMTPDHLGNKSTTGIEIKSGKLDKIEGVLIEGNTIYNISRQAIQVHKGAHSDVVIKNNQACHNLVDFGAADIVKAGVISINEENGVVLDSNRVGPDCTRNPVWASFDGTPKECVIASGQSRCALIVKWKISNSPPGSQPKILVNGGPFVLDGRGDQGSKEAPWIEERDYKFELFLDQADTNPAAVLSVRGKRV